MYLHFTGANKIPKCNPTSSNNITLQCYSNKHSNKLAKGTKWSGQQNFPLNKSKDIYFNYKLRF